MSARFAPGDRVKVRRAYPPGHLRTPYYIRGHAGVVERECGEFHNPEMLAYGRRDEPKQALYRIRFRQSQIWPDYRGSKADTIDIELYEHWLEPT
jgi:nitrile hydratase